ncbi:hypothetical protein FR483_n664R [Paramecium bursaria Chlorella virus FR483]|uniref:Uncharacterized protein n664R n=1 Tax=Paramecium bursaria Chlorella virus FR483 TaxID=399781 RepID=A7J818_PBCVF|nr:hypothetical protein FR483_n664R [Paramecium bursaria Chlorella virus FR483]ABT15949.1 hypothetical protein FR483_n664R [Paramecium bursaria Chlorella virus FR483]
MYTNSVFNTPVTRPSYSFGIAFSTSLIISEYSAREECWIDPAIDGDSKLSSAMLSTSFVRAPLVLKDTFSNNDRVAAKE